MKKEDNLHKFLFVGVLVLLGILLFNSFFVFSIGSKLDAKIGEAKEIAKPAKIEIIKLKSSCTDCFDVDEIIDVLKESGLEITDEKTLQSNSKEAIEIINKYNIEKLPVVVLKGEIEKTSIQNFKQVDDALVFDNIVPPYQDATTKKIVGKVSSIILSDNNCDDCVDFSSSILALKQNGMFFAKEEEFDFSSSKAKEFINKFDIEKLPALFLSKDINAYPSIAQNLEQLASETSGYYVIESDAPYVEAKSGKIRGLITLTMIDDSSCTECYDVEIHKQILARMGLAVDKENKIDVNSGEGQQLKEKYDIEKVPTTILSGDVEVYEGFKAVWQQVGTVEDDGAYIFRKIEALGQGIVHKDLTTGEVVGNTNIQSQ
ncbi:hypothetical protein CMO93_03495 [Candidatus Woesearchaeota archaeon]|nr:hypothetical protein [Candidatus Woesearchaeota archaeon]|tara:strand:+ start:378 stop:1499 length:1122 start_codon:yes stop_codon:yes gene_type:complete